MTRSNDMKVRDVVHPLLAQLEPEDVSRQKAVVLMRRILSAKVRSQNHRHFTETGAPKFAADHGHAPESMDDIEEALFNAPSYRMWSAANRAVQEMLWMAVGEPIFRDEVRLRSEARRLAEAPDRLGSLQLDPDYQPPAALADTDIHLQPGGYALERGESDVVAGALYETGGNVFSFSIGGRNDDSKAAAIGKLIAELDPAFVPRDILDIGCSAGAASAAYAWRHPDAQVHAIDVGPGLLRYAHARAEALGVRVHFHQMDAAALRFEDNSFDLVVSHNLLHEIGDDTRVGMLAECLRVLRPGGLMIHQDINVRALTDPLLQADVVWEKHFNGEVFWDCYSHADIRTEVIAAGFPVETVSEHIIPAIAGSLRWYVVVARKPDMQGHDA